MSEVTLPRLAEGVVDWQKVFDTPGTGLIAQIEEARSGEDLQNAFRLILKTLFNRKGDEERRSVFTNLVNDILTHAAKSKKPPATAMSEVKARVIQILHSIKDDRIKRANKAIAAKARKAEQERQKQGQTGGETKEPETLGFVDRQPDDVHIVTPPEQVVSAPDTPAQETTGSENAEPEAQDDVVEEEKADPAFVKVQQEGDPSIGDFEDWLTSNPKQQTIDEYEDTGGGERKTPEEFFVETIASSILNNMATLRGGLNDNSAGGGKLPFIFSPAFAVRFEQVLKEHILPDFAESSYFMISQMSTKPRAKWLDILTEVMSDATQGLMLWERWKIAWSQATEQQEEPEPPKPDPSKQGLKGFMTKLLGDDDYMYPEEEMTEEEWRELVEATKASNERAKKTWSLLSAPSDEFDPPVNKDNTLLMSLFRQLDDIDTHVAELKRFAGDAERAGRDFDSYLSVNGKDLDLPLLCACFRYPDIFLTGEKTILATFVGSLDRRRGGAALPLCVRFLGPSMGNRFAD